MTALSIPERAREMSKTFFAKEVGIIFGSQEDALTALSKFAESAMRSERDQCVLELTALALANMEHGEIIMDAAQQLRDGGK